ncbi:pyrroline-5-carboxylate reductase [Marinobacterium nitratireducens]|uniref:Pyrroline-5-carboxylate reductase n=1 Tax=Marinobacterium nitratireducens TaxID=518897 RepID=A0A917ZB70_9GAMM|nr:pyrroline-5-carboxylate reductase [Marinobacterium nitratireducens]GGO78070.1 pyrroline-5-carboxylate reductase [Marinobacterium nitratireducens]
MSTKPTVAFIGAGNMARAIIGGLLENGYPAERIWATGTRVEKLADLEPLGLCTGSDNDAAARAADILVLAVKPQIMKAVCEAMTAAVVESRPLVVSVAAGIGCDSLDRWLGGDNAIVRCMPNTPSQVQTGASGLYANARVSAEQKARAESLMSGVGLALWVEHEELLHAVTAVSGSGPAYYFLFMEAMIAAGEKLGLSRDVASQLTLQTALGAARMASASELSPSQLRSNVTSPKGTTEQAILSFQAAGLEAAVEQAMQACARRSRELAEQLKG